MHRFFIDPGTITNQHFSSTDKELCHQVSKVLKMHVGKKIILCDNSEQQYLAEWTLVSKSDCQASIISKETKPDISSTGPLHLYVSPLKNQNRWETILDMCTQLGVASFTPLITERTEVSELRKPERLERIIKEAAEQSGRTKLPTIKPPLPFSELFATSYQLPTLNLIASLHENSQSISSVLESIDHQASAINLCIGPVGDFTKEEVQQAIEHNFYSITLGKQILRTETATIVATGLVLQNYTSSVSSST